MRKLFYALMLLAAFATVTFAQDTKVYVGFANLDQGQTKGVNGSVQFKLYGYGDVRLEAVADGAAFFYEGERFYTLQAGPQVGVQLFHNRLNPFARILLGASKYEEYYDYIYSVGAGVDVNISKRGFVRGTHDRVVFPNGVVAYRTTVGGGLRF